MELAQCRLVTDDVEGLAGFYARLLGVPTALNEYYVEIQAGQASVGFSRRRFTEHREADGPAAPGPAASGPGRRDDIILDFGVDDVDAEYPRIAALDVDWVMPPTTQPWGNRSMMFRDPAGNLVNVFCRGPVLWWIYDACGHDHDAGVGPGALTAVLIKAPGRVLRGFRVPWSLAPHFREEMTMHDHRKLGRELELFDTDPLIGAGLPYLLPAGAAIRHALEEYIGEVERRAGYQHVYSPVLGKRELYEISGHWAHYRDGMYPPTDIGGEQVVLRPSLCPHHAVIYRPGAHSYRDLPLRMAELGGMYRSELSGVLGGLTRVRAIQLNDAHVFRTPNQVAAEAAAALGLIEQAYRALGIEPTRYRLSLPGRDGKYVGGREMWDRATGLLEQVLVSAGVPYEAEEDEAAFYGPKIDVQIADSAEREASLSTVQVDFYLPERFGLEYVGADGARHRPMMVHATLGTPLLVGLFWGAPLVAAEAEAGTTQFAWMQSVTRKRWLAVKIGWMLLAAAVWGGVISALVTWWVSPTNAEQLNQFDPGRFDIMGIVPVGYSLFAVALGVTAGALLRRTLPALAVTLAGFIVVRVAITLWLRSHYISAVTVTYNVLGGYTPKGAYWRLASGVIGPNGQQLPRPNNTLYVDGIPQASLPGACSNLAGPNGGNPTPACTRALSHFHAFLTYQPADRFWAFQGIETGIFLALTAALITVTAVTLLRRDA